MPKKYTEWKNLAVWKLLASNTKREITKCRVELKMFHKRIKSIKKEGRTPKYTKGDLDNEIKSVLDCLVGAQILKDDNAVQKIIAEKWYCAKGEDPHIEIHIFPIK